MGEADGPPVKAAEHIVHRALKAVGVAKRSAGVKLLPCAGDGDAVAHSDGVEFCEDETKLLDGPQASGDSAIGDEGDGLGVPLRAVGIDEGFERSCIAVVVLGRDDDEGVAGGEAPGQSLAGFGRVGLGRVDVFDGEAGVGGDAAGGPLRDGIAEAARASRSVDEADFDGKFHCFDVSLSLF